MQVQAVQLLPWLWDTMNWAKWWVAVGQGLGVTWLMCACGRVKGASRGTACHVLGGQEGRDGCAAALWGPLWRHSDNWVTESLAPFQLWTPNASCSLKWERNHGTALYVHHVGLSRQNIICVQTQGWQFLTFESYQKTLILLCLCVGSSWREKTTLWPHGTSRAWIL